MKFKLHTTPATAALVLSFTGLIALRSDLIAVPFLTERAPIEIQVENSPKLNPIEEALRNPTRLAPLPPEQIDTETLWLARVIFSESKRVEEQALVAWVVRNRVETSYRGKGSYESVALDPHQFSAFSSYSPKKYYYSSLDVDSNTPGWQTAMRVAYDVRHAEAKHRPFSPYTRHFYSERSLGENLAPTWASGRVPVRIHYTSLDVEHSRCRLFEGVA